MSMPKHVVRLVSLIAALLVITVIARWFLIPETFYEFGHFRAASVSEIAALEPVYQTASYCQGCHSERHAQWSASNHKSVTCETCHGPAKGHPQNGKLPIPADSVRLCTLCHEATAGRPPVQPQVQVAQHAGGQQCAACHNPHSPKIVAAAAKVTGDPAAGKSRAAACASCHGADGVSPNETWPSLAGQSAAYLVKIMAAYKSGEQTDVVMTPLAKELSDRDIQDLAVYYAGLACKSAGPGKVGNVAAGKALAKNCAACHGETGIATNPAWPLIAGQTPGYLANVMKAFRAGLRKDPLMAGVSRGLSDADIANLAAYYAAQSCQSDKQGKAKQ
jgi:cytochrome c553